MSQPAQRPLSQYPQFEVIEFSKRRLQRGLAPLSMRVVHGEGDEDVLAGQELYRRRGNASSRGDLE